jgi:hypothetical protein
MGKGPVCFTQFLEKARLFYPIVFFKIFEFFLDLFFWDYIIFKNIIFMYF